MTGRAQYDRAREYLDDIATIADDQRTLKRMKEQDDIEWRGGILEARLRDNEAELIDAENRLAQVGGTEGNALICRYVYLMPDAKLMRTINYSRSGLRKVLDRGIKALYPYLPDEYRDPRNRAQ